MRLEGIHHITAITGDAPGNVDFYARVLGLRLVKKTVNQDQPRSTTCSTRTSRAPREPTSPSSSSPARPGRAGAGMVHTIVWRVASQEALDFWNGRLAAEGVADRARRGPAALLHPEGLGHELLVADVPDAPLIADHPEVPRELALQGFHAARAYSADPGASSDLIEGSSASSAIPATRATSAPPAPMRSAAATAAASGSMTSRPPSPAARALAPSTTSPGPRRWTTTRPGASAPSPAAPAPPRSSTASGSSRSTSASPAASS